MSTHIGLGGDQPQRCCKFTGTEVAARRCTQQPPAKQTKDRPVVPKGAGCGWELCELLWGIDSQGEGTPQATLYYRGYSPH